MPEQIEKSRIITDEFNKIIDLEDVYALGDVSVHSSETNPNGLPMLASVAQQHGDHLAKNLNRKARR